MTAPPNAPNAVTAEEPHSAASGYERADANTKGIVLGAVMVALIVGLAFWGCYGIFYLLNGWRAHDIASDTPFLDNRRLPPKPRLQVDPPADLAALHAYEQDLLETYRWVDQSAGVVAIPIDRAIDLMLERTADTQNGGVDAP